MSLRYRGCQLVIGILVGILTLAIDVYLPEYAIISILHLIKTSFCKAYLFIYYIKLFGLFWLFCLLIKAHVNCTFPKHELEIVVA